MRIVENFNDKVHQNEESVTEVRTTLCSIKWAKVLVRKKKTNWHPMPITERVVIYMSLT